MNEEIIDAVHFPEGVRVLELGGGENRHPQAAVMVDVRQTSQTDFTVDFHQTPMPIADADFDVVYSQFALEHITFHVIPALLKDCLRIVRPGGTVVFITPNTEEQLRWIQAHQEGWNGKDFFNSASELIFGSLDYPENSHRAFLSPSIVTKLLVEAGFENVITQRFGTAGTDMLIQARRPNIAPVVEEKKADEPLPPPETLYDKHYWHGGTKFGGYAGEGYRDFGVHEVTFRHIMTRNPESVLELGAARGYVGKKLEDAGVLYCGLEVSRHCWMTRAVDAIVNIDLCKTPWPTLAYGQGDQFDLAFSIAVFEHIPEDKLTAVLSELKRTTKRGLHGIDFGVNDNGFDKTHVTLKNKSWWRSKFDAAGLRTHEIVDKEELEKGDYQHGLPKDYLSGDGKIKLNVGSFITMFHRGWTNIDVHDLQGWAAGNGYSYLQHDVKKGMPFKTGCVDMIFASHFFEHLSYAEGLSFLRECRRVLKKDGVMRLIVPSAGKLISEYFSAEEFEVGLGQYAEISDGVAEAPTQLAKLHALLQGGDHKAWYDWETLSHALREAKLIPHIGAFRKSISPQMLKETIDMQPEISLFVDATCEVR